MDNIIYTTANQQITKLKEQNLTISDDEYAKENLNLYGYSNLIKSYREPYIIEKNGKKVFRDGVTFEQLCSLYLFDKELRTSIMAAMLDFEEHIKEVTADIIAEKYGTHQNDYLKYRNYRDRKTRNPKFTLSKIMGKMQDTLSTGKDPIHHYATEHGIVPPWILFKGIYFSTIVNLIKFLKIPEQTKLAHRLYKDDLPLQDSELRKLLMDTLFIALEYRNMAAHGGRIYDHDCSQKLRNDEIFKNDDINFTGFSLLVFLLAQFKHQNPYLILKEKMSDEINRHCNAFPEDVTYLGQILNINIQRRTIVFASNTGQIFHKNPHCSGLLNAKQIEFDDAIHKGMQPCKRCIGKGIIT